MFTGLYPTSHRINTAMLFELDPAIDTLPKVFKRLGYQTTAISNVQPNVGLEQGLGRGFDTVKLTKNDPIDAVPVLISAIHAITSANARHTPAFVYFHTDGTHNYNSSIPNVPESFPLDPLYRPPKLPSSLFNFTNETWHVMQDWLLYIIKIDTVRNINHQYDKIYDDLNRTTTLAGAKAVFDTLSADIQDEILWESSNATLQQYLGPEFGPLSRHLYDNAVRDTDKQMNQVFSLISRSRLNRNTIVIVTSEHGEFLGERGLFGHGVDLYAPEIHVPFILHIPSVGPKKVTQLLALIDTYHTLFDLLGIRTKSPTSSISQISAIEGRSLIPARTYVISEWYEDQRNKSLLTDRWHLVETATMGGIMRQLYDVKTDLSETTDVAARYPSITSSLSTLLHNTINAQPLYKRIFRVFPDWIDEAHRQKLIKTGYF